MNEFRPPAGEPTAPLFPHERELLRLVGWQALAGVVFCMLAPPYWGYGLLAGASLGAVLWARGAVGRDPNSDPTPVLLRTPVPAVFATAALLVVSGDCGMLCFGMLYVICTAGGVGAGYALGQ